MTDRGAQSQVRRLVNEHAAAADVAQREDAYVLCGGLVYGPRGICAHVAAGAEEDLQELLRRAEAGGTARSQ